MNQSFVMGNTGNGAVNEDNDSFGDKLNDQEDDAQNNNVNLLDNLYIEEKSAQTESDKLR
jgi:hypothetical protein